MVNPLLLDEIEWSLLLLITLIRPSKRDCAGSIALEFYDVRTLCPFEGSNVVGGPGSHVLGIGQQHQ